MRGVLYSYITPRYKFSLNGLVITKGKYVGASMMLETGVEVAQDHTVFKYGPPRPHKYLKSQDITVVAPPGMKPAPK